LSATCLPACPPALPLSGRSEFKGGGGGEGGGEAEPEPEEAPAAAAAVATFGGWADESWVERAGFFGGNRCFLFRLEPDGQVACGRGGRGSGRGRREREAGASAEACGQGRGRFMLSLANLLYQGVSQKFNAKGGQGVEFYRDRGRGGNRMYINQGSAHYPNCLAFGGAPPPPPPPSPRLSHEAGTASI
jgi:hypothetical protein